MHRYHQKLRSSFRSLQYLPVFSSHPLRKVLHPLLLFRSLRQTAPPLFGYVLNSRLQTLFSVGYSLPLTVSPKHFLPHPLLHRSAHLRFPGRLHLPARSLFHEWLPARSAVDLFLLFMNLCDLLLDLDTLCLQSGKYALALFLLLLSTADIHLCRVL